MKTNRLTTAAGQLLSNLPGNGKRRAYKPRRRYRLELVNENSLTRVWSLKMSRLQAWLVGICVFAAIISLIAMVFLFTPIGQLLPGPLKGDLRGQYLTTAMHIDSLSNVARINDDYARNIINILTENTEQAKVANTKRPGMQADSIMATTERERQFVQRYEEEERFNLSVLSPIAAEGMIFESPSVTESGLGPVASVYRGTVIAVDTNFKGISTVTIQHPNDFITIYTPLANVYINKGDKVVAGQRIGVTPDHTPLEMELWHSGSKLDPSVYISY